MASITITQSSAYITLTYSTGKEVNIPKRNLTVSGVSTGGGDKVVLAWPAGDFTSHDAVDYIILDYNDVTDPALASNTELVALLLSYANQLASSSSSIGGGSSVYSNAQEDFTATANDGGKTITIAGAPFTVEAKHVVAGKVIRINSDDEAVSLPLTNVAVAADVITLEDMSDDFVASDTVVVFLVGPDKAYDRDIDEDKSIVSNQPQYNYTDPEELVSDAGVGLREIWQDQGGEIDCRTFKTLTLWVVFTVNDSITPQLKILSKHESAGSDEYIIETEADYIKSLGDSNTKIRHDFDLKNTVPYVQVQSRDAGMPAAGTTTTTTTAGFTEGAVSIYYTLGY